MIEKIKQKIEIIARDFLVMNYFEKLMNENEYEQLRKIFNKIWQ